MPSAMQECTASSWKHSLTLQTVVLHRTLTRKTAARELLQTSAGQTVAAGERCNSHLNQKQATQADSRKTSIVGSTVSLGRPLQPKWLPRTFGRLGYEVLAAQVGEQPDFALPQVWWVQISSLGHFHLKITHLGICVFFGGRAGARESFF